MKNIIFLIMALLIVSCSSQIADYELDKESGELKPVSRKQFTGRSTKNLQLLIADKMIDDAKDEINPTVKLAIYEIAGRYFLPEGYDQKIIDSNDGTVAGSITNNTSQPSNSGPYGNEEISGSYFYNGWFFLNEDSLRVNPINPDTAKRCWANQFAKKTQMDIIKARTH